MPAPPVEPDALPSPPRVCVCGYDLAGLPPDTAAQCPECGVVIATIVPPVPRFHHWGRTLAAGMAPAAFAGTIAAMNFLWPGSPAFHSVAILFLAFAALSWPLVSIPAFGLLIARATRAESLLAKIGVVALAVPLSLLANTSAFVLAVMAFA